MFLQAGTTFSLGVLSCARTVRLAGSRCILHSFGELRRIPQGNSTLDPGEDPAPQCAPQPHSSPAPSLGSHASLLPILPRAALAPASWQARTQCKAIKVNGNVLGFGIPLAEAFFSQSCPWCWSFNLPCSSQPLL